MLLTSDPARAFMPYPVAEVRHAAQGPLSGLRFAVKDLFDVAGYPTSAGSPTMLALSGIKGTTAPTVQTLLDAGARFVGKTITDELAFSMNGQNAHFGSPINGAAKDRITGGSSSGSAAAVSHGLCDFALGTDTGGSVRAPANHCGLFGIRPTHGRISLEGCHALSPSYDTCGFFARDIGTFARVAAVLIDDNSHSLPAPRVLVATDVFELLAPAIQAALQTPLQQIERGHGALQTTAVVLESFDAMYWAFRHIQGWEAWATDGALITRHRPSLGAGVKERFEWSKNVTEKQYLDACDFRKRYSAMLAHLLGDDGVLILPTMPDIAPRVDEPESSLQTYRDAAIKMLCLSGLTGFPQLSLPLAMRESAPLGISVLGPAGSDRSLIRLAERWLQRN